MVSSRETVILVPSPPLSASAGASDSELDKHKQKHDAPQRLQAHPRPNSRTRSPPSSTPGSFLSASSPDGTQERRPTQLNEGAPTSRCVQDGNSDDDLDDAFSLIKASWQNLELVDVRCPEWTVLHISTSQYLDLCRRLEEHDPELLDYFENVLRSDYDPDRGILVLRLMASAVHEDFQEHIKQFILTRLKEIASDSDPNISHIASNIRSQGHTKMKLASKSRPPERARARKSPDCQFLYFVPSTRSIRTRGRYRSIRYSPQLIIEVGYSQKAKALRRLAQEYYEKSGARTVLTFNLGYSNPTERRAASQGSSTNRAASFSFYRGPDCIHRDTVFRDPDGTPTADALRLCLADLVPDEVLSQLSPRTQDQARNAAIDVTAQLLCQLLAEAEEVQDLWDVTSTPEPGEEDDVTKPLKRRVNWQVDSDSNDAEDDGDDDGDEDTKASSKRRRRDSTYSPPHKPSGTDASLPERQRTRSTGNTSA